MYTTMILLTGVSPAFLFRDKYNVGNVFVIVSMSLLMGVYRTVGPLALRGTYGHSHVRPKEKLSWFL